ncbi:MAG TPA: hypothetical protein VFY36_04515, partial [Solirubrobacteraceae bacterium]|nr:hypothetical protein [Solirubrobacteraceae bacterium]
DAQILGTRVDYPGPDPGVARQLAQLLRPRMRFAAATPTELRSTRLPARAGALSQLASLDAHAATALGRIAAPAHDRAAVAELGKSLAREGSLVSKLASAARRSRRAPYASLSRRFASVSGNASAAVSGVTELGFALGRLHSISIPGLPPRRASHRRSATPAAPATQRPSPPPVDVLPPTRDKPPVKKPLKRHPGTHTEGGETAPI